LFGPDDHAAAVTERLLFEPTCNICGLSSGYMVLAPNGSARDCRGEDRFSLVPDQDPNKILALLRQHLHEQGFEDIEVEQTEEGSFPAQTPIDTTLMQALIRSARSVYGTEPRVLPRSAGTGPMEQLCLRYGVPTVGGGALAMPIRASIRPTKT